MNQATRNALATSVKGFKDNGITGYRQTFHRYYQGLNRRMGYRDYLIKRGLSTIPMFVGLSVLIFTLARVIPGRPARLALGPRATDEAVQRLREQMGLNDPIWVQYIDYMAGLVQGDLGQSLISERNVATDLLEYFPRRSS